MSTIIITFVLIFTDSNISIKIKYYSQIKFLMLLRNFKKIMRLILSLALFIIGTNADWKVVWEDNFDEKELNRSDWHFDGNPGCGINFD